MRRLKSAPAPEPRSGRGSRGDGRADRRKTVPVWMKHARKAGLAAGAVLMLGGGAGWLWFSGAAAAAAEHVGAVAVNATLRAGLRVEEIYVEGRNRTRAEHLLAALQIERGDPILGFDLAQAKARLEGLAWVKTATVERRLPDIVHLRIEERQAVALWQHKGKFMLIDATGHAIADDIDDYAHLLQVVGDDAPAHAAELMALLATEPALAGRVKAAVWVSGRRWNLKLDDIARGIDVRLPEENTAAAWRRLAELNQEHDLLARKVTLIDLRLPDRLVLRSNDLPPPAAKVKTGPGKDA